MSEKINPDPVRYKDPLSCLLLLVTALLLPIGRLAATSPVETSNPPSPDPLQLSLQQAETLFLEQNLRLIAERSSIDIRDAKIRQARLWENPEVSVEHQIIRREGSAPLGFGGSDNSVFEIEQLITTAGKRSRNIRLLELEKIKAQHGFDRLLREFKRSLREEFFHLAVLNKIEGLYQEQIDALKTLLTHFEKQQKKGNIARLEVIRIRGLLMEIEKEYNGVLSDRSESQKALKVLLQLQDETPVPQLPDDFEALIEQENEVNVSKLLKIAYASRSDFLAAQTSTSAAQQKLRLERAGAYPDVGVGLVYDRLEGPVDNYFGLTLNVQLPLWNRNQGNIQAARHQIRRSELTETKQHQSIQHEIEQSVEQYERAMHLYDSMDKDYVQDFSEILNALMKQYQKGDIRLIEFIDFYESFRESTIRTLNIREDFLKAAETLNFTVGQDIFHFNF